jgi:TPR repeat protein
LVDAELLLRHSFDSGQGGDVCCGFMEAEPLMIKLIRSAVFGLLLVPTMAGAQDFDKGLAAYEAGDYATALSEWTPLAEQGDANAQGNLGHMYSNGQGVTQDHAEAVKWFRMAAEQGDVSGQNGLGVMYDSGLGLAEDSAEAVKWYRMAAEQGYSAAQGNLGFMYSKGRGVTQDDTEAMKWYRLAAKQGLATAHFNLGVRYGYGRGVTQDFVAAHMWFNISSARGNKEAGSRRDQLADRMLPADISEAQRRARVCMESNYQDCD